MIKNLLATIRARRDAQRQAHREWQWRMGYLACLDRRLFPRGPAMMQDLDVLRHKSKHPAFTAGWETACTRSEEHSRLSVTAENHMRMICAP